MQFNPVVLFVEMPVYRIFVTKIQKTGRIWTNYTKKRKAKNKKNEQALPNPSPRVRKAQRLFFFY